MGIVNEVKSHWVREYAFDEVEFSVWKGFMFRFQGRRKL